MNGGEHGRRWLTATDMASVPATGGDATDYGTLQIDASGIMRVRTARSDALAAKLLELGAHDLEIVAPTLETAFTALTQDAGE